MQRTALVIGASSGIGLEITRLLSEQGYRLGIAARRLELLDQLAAGDPHIVQTQILDLTSDHAEEQFRALASAVGPTIDCVYLVAGTGEINTDLKWSREEVTIRTNVLGFAAVAIAALRLFEAQGHGHLIGVTSIAALRGSGEAPAYGASKAFACRYLQALRSRAKASGLPIHVTDARPGFVDTAMMKAESPFWVATPEKAARQIVRAADRRRGIVYITRRWALIGWLLKHLPE